jgi:flavodoxin I
MERVAVFVDSRGGNTRKVADAMAAELGIPVWDMSASIPGDTTVLFPGSGTYGGKPAEVMMKFIGSGTFSGRRVALFGTSASPAGGKKMISVMGDALKQKGTSIIGSWHCPGRFLVMNRGRPNNEDFENAQKFAREMLKQS